MNRFYPFAAALLVFLSLPVVQATGLARARLDTFTYHLHSLSGHFTQTITTGVEGQKKQTSTGTLMLKKPHLFRWDTLSPYRQIIVADGHHVWLYEPSLAQVTLRRQGKLRDSSSSLLTLLTDFSQLDKRFKINEKDSHDGLAWLRLIPIGSNPWFRQMELGFSAHDLVRMVLHDQLGATIRITFSHWQRNVLISADTFHFKPPRGSDVIGDTGLPAD